MAETAYTNFMRVILHSDLNNYYASVECLKNPEIRDKPVVVVGEKKDRHGIVLAKNQIAKNAGVKTGDVYWLAKQKAGSELVEVTADFETYLAVSKAVRKIYERYTDRVQAYGIDECWLDVTSSGRLYGSGQTIAEEIRQSIKQELGLSVSIGVSWNKIFAKLGSDMKKPDAVTVISRQNYKTKVWPLPVEELLYVGKATKQKLNKINVCTIGELAQAPLPLLTDLLGKWGQYLHTFANGEDASPVVKTDEEENIKSIGNSLTNYKDVDNEADVKMLIYLLSDAIAARLRETGLNRASVVHISVRSSDLTSYHKQGRLAFPSGKVSDIAQEAFKLFKEIYPWQRYVRSVGVSVSHFDLGQEQLNIFDAEKDIEKQRRLDETVDKLRDKYGNDVIQLAIVHKDPRIKKLDIKGEHVIHPYSFFK